MNAEIVALLGDVLDSDPLTKVRIIEDKGRYVTASAFTGEQFRAYAIKAPAQTAAREALDIIGQDETSIIDETERA